MLFLYLALAINVRNFFVTVDCSLTSLLLQTPLPLCPERKDYLLKRKPEVEGSQGVILPVEEAAFWHFLLAQKRGSGSVSKNAVSS